MSSDRKLNEKLCSAAIRSSNNILKDIKSLKKILKERPKKILLIKC